MRCLNLGIDSTGRQRWLLANHQIDAIDKRFTLTAGVNDSLDFDEGGGEISTALTAGEYTGAALATLINNVLNILGGTYTASYSTTTGLFTITKSAGTVDLLWQSGSNAATSIGTTIGFDVSADTGAIISHVSDFSVGKRWLWAKKFFSGYYLWKLRRGATKCPKWVW